MNIVPGVFIIICGCIPSSIPPLEPYITSTIWITGVYNDTDTWCLVSRIWDTQVYPNVTEMREVAPHESPAGLLAPNDIGRRLFVARMRMPPVPPREPLRLQGLPGFVMMQTPGAADGPPARPRRHLRPPGGDQPEQRPRKK